MFNDLVGLERIGRLYQAVERLKAKLGNAWLTQGLYLDPRSGKNRLKIPVLNIKVM
ncbi:MAG: hypothetical protein ABIK18_04495 [candidate division WOR-3 bacterium]